MSTRKASRAYTSCITSDDIHVDEPYLSIRWDRLSNLVHTEWKAFANSAEFRAGLSMGIQAIRDQRPAAADYGLLSHTFPSMEAATRFVTVVPISSR